MAGWSAVSASAPSRSTRYGASPVACSTNVPSGTTASPSACSTVKSSNAAGSTVPSWAASAYMPTWVVSNGTVVVLAVTQAEVESFHTLVVMVSSVRCSRSRSPDEPGRSANPTAVKLAPASRSVSTAMPDGDSDPT